MSHSIFLHTTPMLLRLAMTGAVTGTVLAHDGFVLTNLALTDGGTLPADLKCRRDGGEGATPMEQFRLIA